MPNSSRLFSFARRFFWHKKPRRPPFSYYWQTPPPPKFSMAVKMSSAAGAGGVGSAALYAVVTSPAQIGAQPEDAEGKAHHLKNGKGFRNPWDSFRDFNPWKIGGGMLWYGYSSI